MSDLKVDSGGTLKTLVIPWKDAPLRSLTSSVGGFYCNDILVVQFTTGPGPSIPSNMPRIAGAEYPGPRMGRDALLSDTPGSFDGSDDPTRPQHWPLARVRNSVAVAVPFTVVATDNQNLYPILKANTTYYLNVKNVGGCIDGQLVDMAFSLSHPGTE